MLEALPSTQRPTMGNNNCYDRYSGENMDNNKTPERIALQDVMLNYAAGVDDRDFDQYRD